ncbi:MAG TPA: hypothetical protein VGP06_15045 [Janthinobacterium sp.]|nr:hypothetical protein [Janthinobacterium sp.]
MENAKVRVFVFDRFDHAEDARQALLAGGLPEAGVQLSGGEDEAGPVEGNFTVGNTDTRTGPIERAFNALIGADNHSYAGNYDKTALRGLYRLQVNVEAPHQQALAETVMQRFGGADIESRRPAK